MNKEITKVSQEETTEILENQYLKKYEDLDTQEAMIMANVLGINY